MYLAIRTYYYQGCNLYVLSFENNALITIGSLEIRKLNKWKFANDRSEHEEKITNENFPAPSYEAYNKNDVIPYLFIFFSINIMFNPGEP